MENENTNYFVELNNVNVNGKVEEKNGLKYLSWAYAWGELKKIHPDATFTVYENAEGWNYHTDRVTCWVKVGVTVNGLEHIETLPVMDYKNKSIPYDNVTSMDVNKAIQRAKAKAIADHGLGLYVYAGEDLPEADADNLKDLNAAKQALTDFCYQYDTTGTTAAKVWKKYKVDTLTNPADVLKILDDYKAKADKAAKDAAKAKTDKGNEMPEEV